MKTDNMYVKFTGQTNTQHINGKKYAVHSASKVNQNDRFPVEVRVETEVMGDFKSVWMPESMKDGDLSISGIYELGVVNVLPIRNTHGMSLKVFNPEPVKPIAEVIDDLIKQSFQPGGRAYQMFKGNCGQVFIKDALIEKVSVDHFHLKANGSIKIRDRDGNVRVRTGTLAPTDREVNEKVRKALRCPDGADIVTWAEILAAGYFGEKHSKSDAIEDAIHYNKNGAYSDDALAKILAAIVNDGTKS